MASANMKYFVCTPDGKEYGPAEQDVLVQWAENGRITSGCMVRNTLVKKWTPAEKIPFLKGLVHREVEPKDKKGNDDDMPAGPKYSLNRPGKFHSVPAGAGQRFGAWLMDMIIVAVVGLLLFVGAVLLIQGGADADRLFVVMTVAWVAIGMLYLTLSVGLTAQTLGQWFWGIMTVRMNGRPVLLGRAFWFMILEFVFLWCTWLFVLVLPGKRALPDMLSGVRVARITVRDIAASQL